MIPVVGVTAFGGGAVGIDTQRADVGIGPYEAALEFAVGAHCICALTSRRSHRGPDHNAPGSGGYIIRPYRRAPGLLVGAACMAARNWVPLRAGVRRFPLPLGCYVSKVRRTRA